LLRRAKEKTMGFDLHGRHETVSFNLAGWRYLLETANSFGWQPAGTEAPDLENVGLGSIPIEPIGPARAWNGGYFTNDFQTVTDDDARQMGAALLRAALAKATKHKTKAKLHLVHDTTAGERHIGAHRLHRVEDDMNFKMVLGFAAFALTSGFL